MREEVEAEAADAVGEVAVAVAEEAAVAAGAAADNHPSR